MMEMRSVSTPVDIDSVASLAHDIWIQHYVPIIGQAQTDYMLAKFQSAPAISRQIADGHQYFVATVDGVPVGYFAIVPNQGERSALLSKIYVSQQRRGTGLGKAILAFVEKRCAGMGIRELWLTVNRNNTGSISFYQHLGFTVSGAVVQDIGNGFVMDDFRMAKALLPAEGTAP
jgi:GNAT superfamily N-acetyltransferase